MLNLAIEVLQIKPEHKILDLFCGIGNFTLVLAKFAKHVTGIEVSDAMVARALENAKLNDIQNVEFFAADLTQEQSDASWSLHTFDSILLDPSRHGAKEILALIAKLNPKKIVYVSCNPATFARDAGILVHEHNYSLVKSGIMDMFPQTDHIETIALFERE
jgi:23S rRNA (uracil1939-C5)-methyltransferase